METEKLIAALRCDESLGSQACKKCPYAADKKNMCLTIDLDAAKALERLTAENAEKDAEIERLKEQIEADSQLKSGLDNANALCRTYKADRDHLQAELDAAVEYADLFSKFVDCEDETFLEYEQWRGWRGKEHD